MAEMNRRFNVRDGDYAAELDRRAMRWGNPFFRRLAIHAHGIILKCQPNHRSGPLEELKRLADMGEPP